MKYEEYVSTSSEITQLEDLLERLPQDMDVERMGLQSQLKRAKERIAGVEPPAPPKPARITFQGRPILDSSGIEADFGAKAMSLFSDIVTTAAAGLSGNLESNGPIPNRQQHEPILTGTAIGSFGFTLEIPSTDRAGLPAQATDGKAGQALIKVQELLEMSSHGSDDHLSQLTDEIHPRAVRKVHGLLDLMQRNEAWFALDFEGNRFQFRNSEQVAAAAKRLDVRNFHEETEIVVGRLYGLMPVRGWFELLRYDNGTVIEGKLGPGIRNPSALFQGYIHRTVAARLTSVSIGQGTPRYTLMDIDLAE